jgi:hypothetical protein
MCHSGISGSLMYFLYLYRYHLQGVIATREESCISLTILTCIYYLA